MHCGYEAFQNEENRAVRMWRDNGQTGPRILAIKNVRNVFQRCVATVRRVTDKDSAIKKSRNAFTLLDFCG
ncbi:hypothetical protein A0G03_18315 [Pectobacterium peruviense]|uniref:Transposase n=1 Tax=Pectobacterium peruviense TaxID=2066479 RepID=A0ABX4S2X2_9GAMM|nr:hypothetical protein A0G03_18315 [Pectobacterium peruviense]